MKQPPFLLPPPEVLQSLFQRLPGPPVWLQAECRNRLVLLLNHVLQQEPAAMQRLQRQCGKTVRASWGPVVVWLQATPAGLLGEAPGDNAPDLQLVVNELSPVQLVGKWLQGDKPSVDIQGDVQLAAEVAWLVDNVRWDVEEDLSRWMGDAAAHTMVQWGRGMVDALRGLLLRAGQRGPSGRAASQDGVVSDGEGSRS